MRWCWIFIFLMQSASSLEFLDSPLEIKEKFEFNKEEFESNMDEMIRDMGENPPTINKIVNELRDLDPQKVCSKRPRDDKEAMDILRKHKLPELLWNENLEKLTFQDIFRIMHKILKTRDVKRCSALLDTVEIILSLLNVRLNTPTPDDLVGAITSFIGITNSFLDNLNLPEETKNLKLFISEISKYLVRDRRYERLLYDFAGHHSCYKAPMMFASDIAAAFNMNEVGSLEVYKIEHGQYPRIRCKEIHEEEQRIYHKYKKILGITIKIYGKYYDENRFYDSIAKAVNSVFSIKRYAVEASDEDCTIFVTNFKDFGLNLLKKYSGLSETLKFDAIDDPKEFSFLLDFVEKAAEDFGVVLHEFLKKDEHLPVYESAIAGVLVQSRRRIIDAMLLSELFQSFTKTRRLQNDPVIGSLVATFSDIEIDVDMVSQKLERIWSIFGDRVVCGHDSDCELKRSLAPHIPSINVNF